MIYSKIANMAGIPALTIPNSENEKTIEQTRDSRTSNGRSWDRVARRTVPVHTIGKSWTDSSGPWIPGKTGLMIHAKWWDDTRVLAFGKLLQSRL